MKWSDYMAQNQHPNPGNFANDREKASQAGKIGGQHSGGAKERSAEPDHKGGQQKSENFADDHEKASEADRKGGSR